MQKIFDTTAYRYPNEQMILALSVVLVLLVIAISATVTLCGSAIFVTIMVGLAYQANRYNHQVLMQHAIPITPKRSLPLHALVSACEVRLQPGAVEVYVTSVDQLNAYTFGLSTPKVVVLFSPLFTIMDEEELMFIIGHEMGHVRLGHTWLNTLVGGMAGIPSPFSAALMLIFAFRWWNRSCEFSADRAGLLACGSLEKAISGLVKLAAGPQAADSRVYQEALRRIEAEDDAPDSWIAEAISTHPMLVRRIQELRRYAASQEYRWLQYQVNQNQA
jgi:Zn-dependent protease with chaperone function